METIGGLQQVHDMPSRLAEAVAAVFFLIIFSTALSGKFAAAAAVAGEQRFRRPDPLGHFRFYKGGFNLTDRHYWASAAFTGVHGYAIAAAWSFCGIGLGAFLILKKSDFSAIRHRLDRCYYLLVFLGLIFTLLAIVATGFVIAASQNSRLRSLRFKDTIVGAGEGARSSIRNVIDAMTKMQYLLLPYDPRTTLQLNQTTHRLGRESRMIHQFVQKNGHSIDFAIQTSHTTHLVLVSVNLLLLLLSLVLPLLHWHPGFIVIIFLCWILTSLFWAMTGFDFFLYTVSEDVCSSFGDFVQDPQNSSLNSLLPCIDELHSDKILTGISSTIHAFIREMNTKIVETISSIRFSEQQIDSPGFAMICDPDLESADYANAPADCRNGAIPVGEFPNLLAKFTCHQGDSLEMCRSTGKVVSEASYEKARAYSTSVQEMLDIYPDLKSLTECRAVKDALYEITTDQCRPFRVSLRVLWASMLALSISMVLLVLLWVVKAYQEKGRSFFPYSIRPNPEGLGGG